jgi:hypothetical protein
LIAFFYKCIGGRAYEAMYFQTLLLVRDNKASLFLQLPQITAQDALSVCHEARDAVESCQSFIKSFEEV